MNRNLKIKTRSYFLLVFCIVFVNILTNHAQVTDDFADGNFNSNPSWTGTTTKFIINASNQLQSNGSSAAADTLFLATPNTLLDSIEWNFYMHLDFNPSTANYCKIYLVSDQPDFTNTLNGYFLRIGETGTSDTLELWRQDGSTETRILTGLVSYGSSFDANIKVTRDPSGNWTLYSDPAAGSNFTNEGTVLDNTYSSTQYFGFYCKYSTTSRFDMYYFDNISIGQIVGDTISPTVESVSVLSDTTLDILFSENVETITAETAINYLVNNGIGSPQSAVLDASNLALVHLTFSNSFTNGQIDTISIQNVEDLNGNVLTLSQHEFMYFEKVAAVYRDIVINEIFADPSPQIGLPLGEFIEIYNTSNKIFDLNGWMFSDPSSSITLGSYFLFPGEYVVLADDDFSFEYSFYENVLLVTTLPSLNNSSDQITLLDDSANVIDYVAYSDTWYQDGIKDGGGYSLEQINPLSPCVNATNWIASNDISGGTPGKQNSVYSTDPDITAPTIISALLTNGNSATICFDESLDSTVISATQITCSGGIGISTAWLNPDLTCVNITFSATLDTGIVYTISINGPTDCSGNIVTDVAEVLLPHTATKGDIIINEVLFNPFTGGEDFVEVYNNSDKFIDLINWKLANWDDGFVANYKTITSNYLLAPNDYCVLTKDSSNIQNNYPQSVTGAFVQMGTLPTYSNDSGTVYLIMPNTDSSISDRFSYSEELQFSLLNSFDGISLERLDFNRATNDPSNWHSAAESAGWATPGRINSQYYPGQITDAMINIMPEIFSPDNDGIDDVLTINYKMEEPGYVGSVTIFDSQGRTIKQLIQNELLAAEGTFSWDGLNNNREKARIGIYIIYFEVFNVDGDISGIKKSCVLASKF